MDMNIYTANYTQETSLPIAQNSAQPNVEATKNSAAAAQHEQNAQPPSKSPRMDAIEISEEGRQASAQMIRQTKNNASLQDSSPAEIHVETLSEYTDTELKQMYYRGEITLQEYEDETGETIQS